MRPFPSKNYAVREHLRVPRETMEWPMKEGDIHDKPWTPLKMHGLEGAYRIGEGEVHVRYDGREKVVPTGHFVAPMADAAAKGLAELALAELIGASTK